MNERRASEQLVKSLRGFAARYGKVLSRYLTEAADAIELQEQLLGDAYRAGFIGPSGQFINRPADEPLSTEQRLSKIEKEAAWELYCYETRNDMHKVDFWEDLSDETQEHYLRRVREY